MATATTEPYRTYTPRPFTRAQRDSTTVLFGGLHWRLERLLQAVLENSGYQARILPVATKEDLLTGRDGRIVVESTEGAGSVFTVELPECPPAPPAD